MGNVFSVPIFFIVFREVIEAAIIISVLLGLVESLVDKPVNEGDSLDRDEAVKKRLVRRMRIQIWAGAAVGMFIALCIGAAFIAVFFTTLNDLWAKYEEIWEGTFSLVACLIIFIMGITMLRIDRSKLKWKRKLANAFDQKFVADSEVDVKDQREARSGKWSLFLLPLITVLREGLECVVFVGGVSLGQSARSIPLAAIVGLICGLIVGYLIYAGGSRSSLSAFLVISTNILFLLGAGLLSKGVGAFERYHFNKGVGADVSESGDGPGSYYVPGNVWHLEYGNPENTANGGWGIFNAILGWTNNATIGTIVSYCLYWIAAVLVLVYMKWSEGRCAIFRLESAAYKRRQQARLEKGKYIAALDSPMNKEVDSLEGAGSSQESLSAVKVQ
ncbi:high-affinity iron transporter [Microbotryum lychnidis-dioicae p1A1 Lamole]|uniref:High-affinity iron transporter n=1 Tax=Microbotryum lychnidis-dioicae (strain p1A1 Lamole / MvSl-1064) TaxID=683840 RepID=U5H8X8_USTV1|nr:high-affinity iron transporter [Microbotryum lychnidis-dioicae p1A1 Lamole]|eukprot:KDE05991.1 high-affinity iron transporter [Microbotryum lychnidis-dioicae p1A1 Lamole]